jgi:hypothetical protein
MIVTEDSTGVCFLCALSRWSTVADDALSVEYACSPLHNAHEDAIDEIVRKLKASCASSAYMQSHAIVSSADEDTASSSATEEHIVPTGFSALHANSALATDKDTDWYNSMSDDFRPGMTDFKSPLRNHTGFLMAKLSLTSDEMRTVLKCDVVGRFVEATRLLFSTIKCASVLHALRRQVYMLSTSLLQPGHYWFRMWNVCVGVPPTAIRFSYQRWRVCEPERLVDHAQMRIVDYIDCANVWLIDEAQLPASERFQNELTAFYDDHSTEYVIADAKNDDNAPSPLSDGDIVCAYLREYGHWARVLVVRPSPASRMISEAITLLCIDYGTSVPIRTGARTVCYLHERFAQQSPFAMHLRVNDIRPATVCVHARTAHVHYSFRASASIWLK